MKKVIFLMLVVCSLSLSLNAQNNASDETLIQTLIEKFAAAGDAQDADLLHELTDKNYRIIMNRMFGAKDAAIMPKTVYLDKIRSKEFGGDQREVSIENIDISGTTARAKVKMIGKKMTWTSSMQFVKSESGDWLLISDMLTLHAS